VIQPTCLCSAYVIELRVGLNVSAATDFCTIHDIFVVQ